MYTCQVIKCLNIPGHRILELSEDKELVVDHLVFCTTHPDEPIKFFCKQCNTSVCITCHVVTHKNHETVTVQDALGEILPCIEHNLKSLDMISAENEKVQETISKAENSIKTDYTLCKLLVENKAEQRISAISKEKENLISIITKEEEKQVKSNQ